MWIGLFRFQSQRPGGFFLGGGGRLAGDAFVGLGGIEDWMHGYHRRGCNNNTTSRQKDCMSQRKEMDIYALFVSSFQAFNQFSGLEMYISGKQRHSP